jgi:hypothetical protein
MNLESETRELLIRNALKVALPVAVAILGAWLTNRDRRAFTHAKVPPLTAPLSIEFEVAREVMALCIARLHRSDDPAKASRIEHIYEARALLKPDDADAIRLAKHVYGTMAAELASA